MLEELRVRELGVIADLDVVLGPGLTVITGETGAGKTLVVEALELVLGGRADPSIVRAGAEEAIVEARFSTDQGDEVVFRRIVPRAGRSRAYIDDHLVPVSALEERGVDLVDLYGQHAHQSLLRTAAQRQSLDAFAGVNLRPLEELRRAITSVDDRLAALGGDDRNRARELDLLRFELSEIEQAGITDENEDLELAQQERRLADARALREAAVAAYQSLEDGEETGAIELLGQGLTRLLTNEELEEFATRLRAALAELTDLSHDLRIASEGFEEDPEQLAIIQERRALLGRLVRKHGEHLGDVIKAGVSASARIEELDSSEERRQTLLLERSRLFDELSSAEQVIGDQRRQSATVLGPLVEEKFAALALGKAHLLVQVPAEALGDTVEFVLAANVGEPFLSLAKAASGGELARVMLALRLVLSSAPATLVFDEVDAGIGGESALAVGRALAELAAAHQVLVVTHLAQVASFADQHLVVEKHETAGRTISTLHEVFGQERVIELSRMLSGHPDSVAARQHAAELLQSAVRG